MVTIDGINYTNNAVLPIKFQFSLDESLDIGFVTLKNMTAETPFEPLTPITIDSETFLISSDNVERVVWSNKELYTHTLSVIEETKLLEKFIVDSCTFTNSLIKDYSPISAQYVGYDLPSGSIDIPIQNDLVTPYTTNTEAITIRSSSYVMQTIAPPNNKPFVEFYKDKTLLWSTNINSEDYLFTDIAPGIYYVRYYVGIPGSGNNYYFEYTFVIVQAFSTQDITITDVVNRLLAIVETKRQGNAFRFQFDSTQATKYARILSPEFAMTKQTLREALSQVGGYIHAIPRLKTVEGVKTIFFDSLDGTNLANLPNSYISKNLSQDIEQFCSELDTNVENLVNIDDEQSGTITEPYYNGWKTPRTETGTVVLTQDNAFIQTTLPIEKIIKVEMGYLNNNTLVGDITDFVYEQAEYTILSSYGGTYPDSKAWALYYTQGQNNIQGLNFQLPDAVSPFFKNASIVNIVNSKLGTLYTNSLFDTNPMVKMQFRVTYIPLVSARIKQRKPYLSSTKRKSVLSYTQSENKVDTDYYGEHLKGVVSRLGNIERVLSYIVPKTFTIPAIGTKFNSDYWISVVKVEKLRDYNKFTIGLSKDFNRWNEYVGINNNLRIYEVSEKQSIDRYVIYEDYCIIGDNVPIEEQEKDQSIISDGFLNAIDVRLRGDKVVSYILNLDSAITNIQLITYEADGETIITPVVLPAVCYSFGNSAFYGVNMASSFSAGDNIKAWQASKGYQQELQYSNALGKAEYLKVVGRLDFLQNITWDYNNAVSIGSNVPKSVTVSGVTTSDSMFSTGNANIILKKDSRENIFFGYQIHCVTNRNDIIVGSGLPKKFAVTSGYYDNGSYPSGDYQACSIYVMNREIGKFEKEIKDIPVGATPLLFFITPDFLNKYIDFGIVTCNVSGKSIIIVDERSNELLFAINGNFEKNQEVTLPRLMFRHIISED